MKKYELTNEYIEVGNVKLYRIRALRDIPKFGVKTGDLGGYVQSEDNLSHYGECWVSDSARVFDNALLTGDARVYDNARVFGNALVSCNARVYGLALVSGEARVFGSALVFESAIVSGSARVYGLALVFSNAWVSDHARVSGNARVYGSAHVFGNAHVTDLAQVLDDARVSGSDCVSGSAKVFGDTNVSNSDKVGGLTQTFKDSWVKDVRFDMNKLNYKDETVFIYKDDSQIADIKKVAPDENVCKPNYYKSKSGQDVMDVVTDFGLDFLQANVLKYIVRYKNKNGLEDLKKAREYIDRMIQFEQKKKV